MKKVLTTGRIVRFAGFLAVTFLITPGLAVCAWLMGYGSGGLREVLGDQSGGWPSGSVVNWILESILIFAPWQFLLWMCPSRPEDIVGGIAVSAVITVCIAIRYFFLAAGIASV